MVRSVHCLHTCTMNRHVEYIAYADRCVLYNPTWKRIQIKYILVTLASINLSEIVNWGKTENLS